MRAASLAAPALRRRFAALLLAFRFEGRGRVAPAVGQRDLEQLAGQRETLRRLFIAERARAFRPCFVAVHLGPMA